MKWCINGILFEILFISLSASSVCRRPINFYAITVVFYSLNLKDSCQKSCLLKTDRTIADALGRSRSALSALMRDGIHHKIASVV